MFNRIKAIILKEFYHIFRDMRSLAIVIAMPVMMVLLYGYALNMDIKNIRIAIVDYDKTPESREIIRSFSSSKYFKIADYLDGTKDIDLMFRQNKIKGAVVIPKNFGKNSESGKSADIQIIVDGSDPTFGNATANYSTAILFNQMVNKTPSKSVLPFDIRERFLYNPDLLGADFIIPGIVAVILMMVCALLTSITIAREKETGTMDILMVSPVRPYEIIFSKVIPYVVVAFADAIFILIFSKIVFDIPFRGSLLTLLLLSLVYIYCALCIGVFISSVAASQQVAMMAALVATIMPSVLLSGFIFPIFSMPVFIRYITSVVPATHYIKIIRGIMLKASTLDMLAMQGVILLILGTLFLLAASLRFKERVR